METSVIIAYSYWPRDVNIFEEKSKFSRKTEKKKWAKAITKIIIFYIIKHVFFFLDFWLYN